MSKRCLCPVCFHRNQMEARLEGYETEPIEIMTMTWVVPRSGLVPWWFCEACGFKGVALHVGTLLDAVLMLHDCCCPTIEDGVHADARDALEGGAE